VGALLGTRALIWWAERDARITPALRGMLAQPEDVFVSAASAWEIAAKVRPSALDVPGELLRDFVGVIEDLGFLPLPVSLRHGFEAGSLPGAHTDPFDRMLAAQACAEGLLLVSSDPAFRSLGVPTFW
jgi:PIN domain nuclease of toxin-antitoxin system